MPDPVKRIERLGKLIYPTEEFADLHDRWISFKDQMKKLTKFTYHLPLIEVVASRYFVYEGINVMLMAIVKLVLDENEYKSLFGAA